MPNVKTCENCVFFDNEKYWCEKHGIGTDEINSCPSWKSSNVVGEVTVKVNIDADEAIEALKKVNQEARDTLTALRELSEYISFKEAVK